MAQYNIDQTSDSPDVILESVKKTSSAATTIIVFNRFKKNQMALIGLIILLFFITLAILSYLDELTFAVFHQGLCANINNIGINNIGMCYRPDEPFAGNASSFENPSFAHPFGTDNVGRDILIRIIYGARISITVGFLAVIVSLSIGTVLGLIAGYFGGKVDSVISMFLEILLAFPSILLALGILFVLGSSLTNAMIAVGIVYIPYYARVVRGQTLVERGQNYVDAAKVLGVSTPRILTKHILPNNLGVLIIYSTLGIGTAILEVAALSFLGLGALPPTAEWGAMIADGRKYFATSPHLVFFPGLAILFTVISFNLVGDGLREALDPRFKS